MTAEFESLGDAWHAHALQWAAWASAPGHDSYWQFHRSAFLPLVPEPGRLTLDVGCGEGRVSRDLADCGHHMLALDRSPTLAAATGHHAERPVPAVAADAAALPLPGNVADCAIAFMSLQDVDDMAGAIGELARVLEPGGRLVLAIVHPLNSAGKFVAGDDPERPFVIENSWTRTRRYADSVERAGLTMTFHSEHRPLQDYTEALSGAGFVIERMREPTDQDPTKPWRRIPLFLDVRAMLWR